MKRIRNQQDFIEKAKIIHGDKYDYSKVNYIDSKTKVTIICPIHGEFYIKPNDHISRRGCPRCGHKTVSFEEFVERANIAHKGKYSYIKESWKGGTHSKTDIICPIHGIFTQEVKSHLRGVGCPMCNSSKLENIVKNALVENEISFIQQAKFDWLKTQSLDFYLPKYNVAIECQGIQHFEPRDFSGKDKNQAIELFELTCKRDKIKKELCEANNVKLLYFSNLQMVFPYDVYTNIDELIKELKAF